MNNKQDKIEIPFGVKDSEFNEFEYTIPDGFEAEIKDGKVIVRKAESEDERIIKAIKSVVLQLTDIYLQEKYGLKQSDCIAWLEKQGEHANFRNKIQVGDEVTHNEDGVLVNLSQLNRVAKKDENQGEQKPADKVEPKFKPGDWISGHYTSYKVLSVNNDGYVVEDVDGNKINILFENEKFHHLWTIQDAKDGDVLATLDYILIFKEFLKNDGGISYCHYDFGAGNPQFIWFEDKNWYFGKEAIIHPATKEQCDLLFQKMKEAGYEWDAEKKELKKVEHNLAWSEEYERIYRGLHNLIYSTPYCDSRKELSDFLDSLKNRVQSNLQQEWSEEDEKCVRLSTDIIDSALRAGFCVQLDRDRCVNWLKSIKDRVLPQSQWKPSEEQMKALSIAMCGVNDPLFSLYQDLKKLMEE